MAVKYLLLIFALVSSSRAAPSKNHIHPQDDVQLVRYESDNFGLGNYNFAFDQSDGTKRQEQGELRNEGQEDEFITMRGSYSWVGPDGVTYTVTYVADENGFQPTIEQGPGGGVPPGVVASLLG